MKRIKRRSVRNGSKRSKKRRSNKSKKRSSRGRSKCIKKRGSKSLSSTSRRRLLRTRLSPRQSAENKRDLRFYVLGLCSCDTRQQRDAIEFVIKNLQEKALLPMDPYEIHMVNDNSKFQTQSCVPSESTNVFNKRFLFEFGKDPLPFGLEKHKYTVIFNHFCPYFVLTQNIPLLKEMMRTDYPAGPYLIQPVSNIAAVKIAADKRYEQLTGSFDQTVPNLGGGLGATGLKKNHWSVYKLKLT